MLRCWFVCFAEVSQLEQLQKGEHCSLTLAELWYRSQPSMDTFALLQHGCLKLDRCTARPRPPRYQVVSSGQVCIVCMRSLYPNLFWICTFGRQGISRNQRKEDDVGGFNATWPRYRITSHVQGLKGGAVLNGTMAVKLFEEVVCLCHDSSWVVLSYPFLLAGFKMTDKRNSLDNLNRFARKN